MTIEQCSSAAVADFSIDELADRVLAGGSLTEADCLNVLATGESQRFALVAAVSRVRRRYFSNTVKVNYLVNLKSGLCPEDCGYCSQRLGSEAEILKYSWLSADEAADQAQAGLRGGASRVCLVASGRGPSNRDVERVADMVGAIREQSPGTEVCACLGLLKDGQAERLAEVGVDAYNHNINTAESNHENIVTTHTYQDRVDTVERAKGAGLSPCSGLIVGMGESDAQIVEALFALRDMNADSLPINFLMPFEGTPMEGTWELTPHRALVIVCLARLVCPDTEVRLAGGREIHLRGLQPLAMEAANSLFLGDYLTSQGQAAQQDLEMLSDHGFVILTPDGGHRDPAELLEEALKAEGPTSQSHDHTGEGASGCAGCSGEHSDGGSACGGCPIAGGGVSSAAATDQVSLAIRRRGAGTQLAPNA